MSQRVADRSLFFDPPFFYNSTVLAASIAEREHPGAVRSVRGTNLTGLELFRLRRTQLHLRCERQKTARRALRCRCKAGIRAGSQFANDRRWYCILEVGID